MLFSSTLLGYVYITFPYFFDSGTGEDISYIVMKLNKRIFVLVQALL